MRRHRKIPAPIRNLIIPEVGRVYMIYMSRTDIGNGYRLFICTQKGPKWIVLLVPAQLKRIKLTWQQWQALPSVQDYTWLIPDMLAYANNIQALAERYDAKGMDYHKVDTDKAVQLLLAYNARNSQ